MRPRTGMARILIPLLVLRVLGAPIAARPDPPRPPSTARFIVRVCAWPAQGPRGLITPGALTARPDAPEGEPSGDLIAPLRRHARGRVTASALRSRLGFRVPERDSPPHLSDRPRC